VPTTFEFLSDNVKGCFSLIKGADEKQKTGIERDDGRKTIGTTPRRRYALSIATNKIRSDFTFGCQCRWASLVISVCIAEQTVT